MSTRTPNAFEDFVNEEMPEDMPEETPTTSEAELAAMGRASQAVSREDQIPATYAKFKAIMRNEGVELRRNQRTLESQFRVSNPQWPAGSDYIRRINDGQWHDVTDLFAGVLRNEIISINYRNTQGAALDLGKDKINEFIESLATETEFDDFGAYLDGLGRFADYNPDIDGDPSLRFWREGFGNGVTHYNADWDEYLAWACRVMIWTAVARHYQPGAKQEQWTHLIGPWGCGKSSAFPNCLPANIRETMICDNVDFGLDRKAIAERTIGKAFVEFPEAVGYRYTENAKIKAMMTATDDQNRPAYGRRNVKFPRQWVGYITSNPNERGSQKEQDRRFMVVELKTERDGELLPLWSWLDETAPNRTDGATNRDVLWLQALAARDANSDKWHLPPKSVVEQVVAESLNNIDPANFDWDEQIEELIRYCQGEPGLPLVTYIAKTKWWKRLSASRKGEDMTIPEPEEAEAEINVWLQRDGQRFRSAAIGKLKSAGYVERRPRAGNEDRRGRWYPPQDSPQPAEPTPVKPTDDELEGMI